MKKWIMALALVAGMAACKNKAKDETPDKDAEASQTPQASGMVRAPAGGFNPQFVASEAVTTGTVPDAIPITGKLAFNEEHLHLASARVAGRLNKILVFEGAKVSAGQALAELYSPDYVSAENEFLLSLSTVNTFEKSEDEELVKDARDTRASAINRLKMLGAAQQDIDKLAKSGSASMYLIIRAPISGTVIKREVDPGAYLDEGDDFMTIADVSKLWFYGNIYEQDYSRIKLGQELELKAEALPGKTFKGIVSYIAPSIDPDTHTLPIRCDVPNPTGELRPEIFVTARLALGTRQAVIVPRSAVIHVQDDSFIIVDKGNGLYQRVMVEAADLDEDRAAVFSGLQGNERVVIKGTTLINNLIGNQ